jgi:cytochrome oxidase Cu insertion factor (SCO1/SenC/PrrC family)
MQSVSELIRNCRLARWRVVLLGLLIFVWAASGKAGLAQLPPSTGAPAVGQKAPGFTLPDQHGNPVSLAGLLKSRETPKLKGIVLIFYRGYW